MEQQIGTNIKKGYAELEVKFKKFQRPADFEPKMAKVKNVLEQVAKCVHLIELNSYEPEIIQGYMEQCMKLYKMLSDIKGEVEYVIKTGRVLVEKGQVDYPDHVSKQIDRLKIAYNEFGSQVTEGKTDLEKVGVEIMCEKCKKILSNFV